MYFDKSCCRFINIRTYENTKGFQDHSVATLTTSVSVYFVDELQVGVPLGCAAIVQTLNIPMKEQLTCSVCQKGNCLETLLLGWSLNHSSSLMASRSEAGQSLCEGPVQPYLVSSPSYLMTKSNSNLHKNRGLYQVPRSLFQSLIRTFANVMTSSSVQCFLMLFTDTPILDS